MVRRHKRSRGEGRDSRFGIGTGDEGDKIGDLMMGEGARKTPASGWLPVMMDVVSVDSAVG